MGILSWWFAVVLCFLFTLRRGEILSLLQALTTMMLCLSSQSQVTMHRILLVFSFTFFTFTRLLYLAGLSRKP